MLFTTQFLRSQMLLPAAGHREHWRGPGQMQKVWPIIGWGAGGMPPGNFDILLALKCVLEDRCAKKNEPASNWFPLEQIF